MPAIVAPMGRSHKKTGFRPFFIETEAQPRARMRSVKRLLCRAALFLWIMPLAA